MASVAQNWRPTLEGKIHPEAVQAIQRLYEAVKDHDQAIVTIDGNMKSTATTTASGSSTMAATVTQTATAAATKAATTAAVKQTTALISSTFGNVNQQSASYTTQNSDYGSLVTFSATSAVTATLNQAVKQNFLGAVQNNGTAMVTLQPQTGQQINSLPSLDLPAGSGAWIFYDGMNYWAVTAPASVGFANPMTALGDLIVGGTAGAPQRLAVGAAGTVLTSNGSTESWQAPAASGVTSLNTATGAVTLAAGSNVTITESGETITIASSGGGGGGSYYKGSTTISIDSDPAGKTYSQTVSVPGAPTNAAVVVTHQSGDTSVGATLSGYVSGAVGNVVVFAYFPPNYSSAGATSLPVYVLAFP